MKNDKQRAGVYTSGPIGTRMLKTAAAMLMGTLAMSGYNIVDTYFVSNLGGIPLAAMGFTFPVIMLIGCVFHGIGTGVMTPMAQFVGGKRTDKAQKIVTAGVLLTLIVSIVIAALGILTTKPLFAVFGAKGITLSQVQGYMNIWYFGCATSSLAMLGNDILVAMGDSKRASLLMVLGLLMNAALDPLFISGWGPVPQMGIRGAALATIICQCMSTVATLGIVSYRHNLLTVRGRIPWKEISAAWRLTMKYAIPASLGMLMMPIGSAIITWITARFGDAAVAATAATGRLEMVAFAFPMALGITLTPMVAQNYGAKLYSRIRKCLLFSTGYAFIFLMSMAVLYFIFKEPLVQFFSPKSLTSTMDQEVRRIMVLGLYIIPWGFAFIEIHRFAGFFYIGCGRPAVAAWLNAFRIIGLMIPFSFLALLFDNIAWLFAARMLADIIAGSTGFLLAWNMTRHLPKDDGTPQPKTTTSPVFRRIFHLRHLHAFGTAQAKIDNTSDTQ